MDFEVRRMVDLDVAAVAALSEEGFGGFYQFDWQLNARARHHPVRRLCGRADGERRR